MSDLPEATFDGGLQPGELVDGRYALVKPLGRGGMGEVWYAFDGQTGGQVALKFVRGKDGAPPSPALRARQLREARAAQRVQHPRVVALHGIVDDQTHGRVIVMDYLEGESLADKIARHGALPLGEAAGLALDLCEGLGAAHAVGVVHRDLKPSNVLLVPGEGGVRPCLIDFGVAKLLSLADEAVSSTAGGFAGTPMYMAPEQLFGEGDVDHRADIWSLGLLLFDALTGHTPTAGAHLGEVLKKVLEGPLPRACSFSPELPAALDQVLARMLLRDRAERPTLAEVAGIFAPFAGREAPTLPLPAPNALAFAETLEARRAARAPAGPLPTTLGSSTGPLPTTLDASAGPLPLSRSVRPVDVSRDGGPASSGEASSGRRWGNLGAMAAVAALVAGVLGAGARYRAAFGEPPPGRAGAHRVRSFAVIGPSADLSPEAGSAQTLARTLALGWASSAELRVVPPEAAAHVGQARELGSGARTSAAARAAAEVLGVDALVVVRASRRLEAGEAALAQIDLYAPSDDFRGETLTLPPDASEPGLLGLERRVRERFELHEEGAVNGGLGALGLPTTPRSIAHALLAQRALHRGDLAVARRELGAEGVAALEAPTLRLARAQLKAAEGDDVAARALAAGALAAAGPLAREERLALEAEVHALAFDFAKAVDAQRALWVTQPEALGYGLRLAELLVSASRASEALEVLAEVGARQPSDESGRVGVALGQALYLSSDRERAAAELIPAVARAERAGNVEAAARGCVTLARKGDTASGREYAERARALYASVGDDAGVVRADVAAASAALRLQRVDEAREAILRARHDVPAGGKGQAEAQILGFESWFAMGQGELRRAQGIARDALATARATGNQVLVMYALNNLSAVERNRDEADQAMQHLREAVATAKAVGDRHQAAVFQQNIALGHLRAGQIFRAREVVEEAVLFHRAEHDRYHIAWALETLGSVELASAHAVEARRLFEEALQVRTQAGLIGSPSRVGLAEAMRAEGRPADALATYQQAIDEARGRQDDPEEAYVLSAFADFLAETGDWPRARAATERAFSLGDEDSRALMRIELAPVLARIEFAGGDRGAPERLERVLRAGAMFEDQRVRARLALGQLWVRGGQRSRGRALLGEVIADARSSGHLDVVLQAERILGLDL